MVFRDMGRVERVAMGCDLRRKEQNPDHPDLVPDADAEVIALATPIQMLPSFT